MAITYYELKKVVIPEPKDGEFSFATAAVITCSTCGEMIDGMGGPGDGAICERCAELIKSGKTRGAIVWTG